MRKARVSISALSSEVPLVPRTRVAMFSGVSSELPLPAREPAPKSGGAGLLRLAL